MDDVVVIDTPEAALCTLPSARRFCVSMTCPAALTPRGGTNHYTRCALDGGALVPDERPDPLLGDALVRRRPDCAQSDKCEVVWLRAHPHDEEQARCPEGCTGYVDGGVMLPAWVLTRMRPPPRKGAAS